MSIEGALQYFEILKISDEPERWLAAMVRELENVEDGYKVLDPTGQKTAPQMQQEVERAVRKAHLRAAAISFRGLQRSSMGARGTNLPKDIREKLKLAKADYKDLARELGLSASRSTTMRGRIHRSERQAHIRSARHMLNMLKADYPSPETTPTIILNSPETVPDLIREDLKAVHANYASLDENGKKSSKQMKAEVARYAAEVQKRKETRERQIPVETARFWYQELHRNAEGQKSRSAAQDAVDNLKQTLESAKLDYKILDPSGKRTGQELRKEVEGMLAQAERDFGYNGTEADGRKVTYRRGARAAYSEPQRRRDRLGQHLKSHNLTAG
ncbi:MAG: hypothetical protein SFW62_03585 [Alphaproteobacteria bacterium]|nr:hypothetical protein [Alphaproteobacteria bacterium]